MTALKEISDEKCEMEMTPMIDVTFLLLIFFVCTIKFKTLEGKLAAYLPKTAGMVSTDDDPIDKIDIVLRVKNAGHPVELRALEQGKQIPWSNPSQGDFSLVGHEVEYSVNRDTFADDESGLTAMSARLKQLLIVDPERAVTIKAMQGVVYKDIIPVLDTCIHVGFANVTFAGSYGQ